MLLASPYTWPYLFTPQAFEPLQTATNTEDTDTLTCSCTLARDQPCRCHRDRCHRREEGGAAGGASKKQPRVCLMVKDQAKDVKSWSVLKVVFKEHLYTRTKLAPRCCCLNPSF